MPCQKAIDIANAMEIAGEGALQLARKPTVSNLHKMIIVKNNNKVVSNNHLRNYVTNVLVHKLHMNKLNVIF